MRRMDRGFKDPFPRLPPGCTPSDIPGNRPQDVPPEERPDDAEDDQQRCMVCCPPDKVAGRFKEVGSDLSRLPYCDDHDADDLRAKLERDEDRRQQEDHENPPPESWRGNHDGAD